MAPAAGTAPLREILPNQCMLLADVDLLKVKNSKLWVDQLYIRFQRSDRQPATLSQLEGGQFFHFIDVQVVTSSCALTPRCCAGDIIGTKHRVDMIFQLGYGRKRGVPRSLQ